MIFYIYIDFENMSYLQTLPSISNGRYFVFLGANQKDSIKYCQGIRVKKIKCERQEKDFLDCKLIDCFLKRKNIKNVYHYIISKDKGFDSWINFTKATSPNTNIKRIENFNEIININNSKHLK